jgi:hypothetical protein
MTRWEAWLNYISNFVVGLTGLVYGFFLYFHEGADEFSRVTHPLQVVSQDLHVVTAPLLVFACGVILKTHVLERLGHRDPKKKFSGWMLLLAMVPMVVSGYLVQVITHEAWRPIWVGTHIVSSIAWLLGFGAHLVPVPKKLRRSR